MTVVTSPEKSTAEYAKTLATPSPALIEVAAVAVANSLLMHSESEKRNDFQGQLINAMGGTEVDEKIVILAGLKELGLGYKKNNQGVSVNMHRPRLSNPNPEEFSSVIQGALSYSDNALELVIEKGREVLSDYQSQAEVNEWLQNMEVAVSSQTN